MSPLFYYKKKKDGNSNLCMYHRWVRHNCPMTEVLHLNGRNVKKEKALNPKGLGAYISKQYYSCFSNSQRSK